MTSSSNLFLLGYQNLELDVLKVILLNQNYYRLANNIFQKYACVDNKDLLFLKVI